uniref:Uncharacterized protein n=1 Tax=Magallana gigas TaxID=29159 RepID=K1QB07_MAGGI
MQLGHRYPRDGKRDGTAIKELSTFFIDHSTKKTTWIDPRIAMVKHPPPETTDDHLEETIKELVKSCPGAGQQMVKDVLASCDNDKFKAKIALRAMGYTDSAEGSTKRDTIQGRESRTKHTYIKQRVIRAFPELEADVIDIALNICKYKEGECRTLLKGWNEKKKPEMSSRSKTDDSGFSDFSSRPTTSMSTEPVPIDMNAGLPVTMELDPVEKKQTQVPVTREQHFARSEYRTMAVGPNSELRHGPDESLLITDRLVAMGPNPDLQQGPDESRLGERTVAVGPNPDLVQGPMFQASPTRLIISAV